MFFVAPVSPSEIGCSGNWRMLNTQDFPLGCILGTNAFVKGLCRKAIRHIAGPLSRVCVWVVDRYVNLQALLVIRDKRRVALFSSQTSRHLFMTLLSGPRVFVIDQTVTFDHVHVFALGRAEAIDHGVWAHFDTHRIDNQGVPFIVADGMPHR